MAFDVKQFRDLVKRVLTEEHYTKGFDSEDAIELLLGTCAVESDFGTYIRQLGDGHALSVFQIEFPTFKWLVDKYPLALGGRRFDELLWDLRLAILVARFRYWAVPEKLPSRDNVAAMADYWKRYYNSIIGAGRREDFIRKYKKFVLDRQ